MVVLPGVLEYFLDLFEHRYPFLPDTRPSQRIAFNSVHKREIALCEPPHY